MNKKIIEQVKISESKISMILGIVVVVVVGALLFNYFKGFLNNSKKQLTETSSSLENEVTPSSQAEEGKPKFTGELPTKYIVAKNDSLWKISQNFYGSGYNWVDISNENKLKNPNVLAEGQELTIPKIEPKRPIISGKIQDDTAGVIEGEKYEIQKGDNLWKISVRAYQDGYKWPQIAKANNLSNPNVIHAGNVLTIPR